MVRNLTIRKLAIIAAVLALLTLLTAPLVLAQEETTSQQPDSSASQPAASLPVLEDPYSSTEDGNVIVDCGVAFRNFARLELVSGTFANDPQFQADLANAQSIAQFCVDQGFSPTGDPGSPPSGGNGTDQYQPVTQPQPSA